MNHLPLADYYIGVGILTSAPVAQPSGFLLADARESHSTEVQDLIVDFARESTDAPEDEARLVLARVEELTEQGFTAVSKDTQIPQDRIIRFEVAICTRAFYEDQQRRYSERAQRERNAEEQRKANVEKLRREADAALSAL